MQMASTMRSPSASRPPSAGITSISTSAVFIASSTASNRRAGRSSVSRCFWREITQVEPSAGGSSAWAKSSCATASVSASAPAAMSAITLGAPPAPAAERWVCCISRRLCTRVCLAAFRRAALPLLSMAAAPAVLERATRCAPRVPLPAPPFAMAGRTAGDGGVKRGQGETYVYVRCVSDRAWPAARLSAE